MQRREYITLDTIILLGNSLILALALGLLFIVLWHDSRKELNQFFAFYLLMTLLWNTGSLLIQISTFATEIPALLLMAISTLEIGFVGSSIGIYILTTIFVGTHSRRHRIIALVSILLFVVYRIANRHPTADIATTFSFQPLFLSLYIVFNSVTLFLLWRHSRKIKQYGIIIGIIVFIAGQSLVFVNPTLNIASFSTVVASIGTLVISVAIIQQEIITPLSEQLTQIEAMHKVSLAVSSQIAINMVLDEIAIQAADWIGADAACIFLSHNTTRMKLVAVHNMPRQLINSTVDIGQGVAGTVVKTRKSLYLENYNRDWSGLDDFYLSRKVFGAVIGVPLVYANEVIGTLIVISGQHGKLFDEKDIYLLELIAAQAAVAISHSHLFEEQQQLTREVDAARSQLEAVLTSTDNPVIALDRHLKIIFANPAAYNLFSSISYNPYLDELPLNLLPSNIKQVLRKIKSDGSYNYELSIQNDIYLCHVSTLGESRIEGWVAVLNDITQLKELDRMKSEMVRMASHDLKNPLMGAMAYLELLRDELRPTTNDETKDILSTVELQLERMNRIIRGILDIENVRELSSLDELCAPSEILDNALVELEHSINAKGIKIVKDVDIDSSSFRGNNRQFERAIINLLENAIKFTLKDGVITIKIYNESENVVFEITDNGVGIPDDIIPRVFDRFFRGNQKGVEHVTGTGLGLNLVKTIIEKHNGTVWAESEVNRGATFYISVPAYRSLP